MNTNDAPEESISFTAPAWLAKQIRHRARVQHGTVDAYLVELLRDAVMLEEMGKLPLEGEPFVEIGGNALVQRALVESAGPGLIFATERDEETGELDQGWLENEVDRVTMSLSQAGLPTETRAFSYEVGRGAQGDPFVLLEICASIYLIAKTITEADKVLPVLKKWLAALRDLRARLGGDWNLTAVKLACLEHALAEMGEDADAPPLAMITGSRATAVTWDRNDEELVGPYYVSVPFPKQKVTLLYVARADGTVLSSTRTDYIGPSLDELQEMDTSDS